MLRYSVGGHSVSCRTKDWIFPSDNLPPFPWSSLSCPWLCSLLCVATAFSWISMTTSLPCMTVTHILVIIQSTKGCSDWVCRHLCGSHFRPLRNLIVDRLVYRCLGRLFTTPRSEQGTSKKTDQPSFTGTHFPSKFPLTWDSWGKCALALSPVWNMLVLQGHLDLETQNCCHRAWVWDGCKIVI